MAKTKKAMSGKRAKTEAEILYYKSFQGAFREGIDPPWSTLPHSTRKRWISRAHAVAGVAEPELDETPKGLVDTPEPLDDVPPVE